MKGSWLVLLVGVGVACSSEPASSITDPSNAPPSNESSSGSSGSSGSTPSHPPDNPPVNPPVVSGDDKDGDGIADAQEAAWAAEYMPFISVHPSDGCKTHGILYRMAKHPKNPKHVMLWADILWDKDCGANGHAGDNEMLGVVFDPSKPAPEGILAVRAISHQNTPCEKITTCGASCAGGLTACSTGPKNGKAYPVLYPSKDKHGNYVDKGACSQAFVCDFGGCALATTPSNAPMVNAGEPGKSLVKDLTSEGFITPANGWVEPALQNFDPWKAGNFGKAGDVSKDLIDDAFVIDTAACP